MQKKSISEKSNILIAGASSDIAQPIIQQLLGLPVKLGLHCHNSQERLRNSCSSTNNIAQIRFFDKDLSDTVNGENLVEEFTSWAGGLDIFIQLTGNISSTESWKELSSENWNNDIAVNLTVPFFMTRAAVRSMKKNGRIVLMSTASASHGGGPNSIAYSIAKAGLESATKALSKFCSGSNILINAVCPGFISTRFHSEKAKKTQTDIEKRIDSIGLMRAGTPEDVASLILFLVSEENNFITGQCICIDGGDFV